MKAYIAGPFFNDSQKSVIDEIQRICDIHNIETYNPKEVSVYKPGKGIDTAKLFSSNVEAINSCDILIAVTDGKDPGTLFESGYAYCHRIPIVYVWLDNRGMKFNIMLKESSLLVCKSLDALSVALLNLSNYKTQKEILGLTSIFNEGELE